MKFLASLVCSDNSLDQCRLGPIFHFQPESFLRGNKELIFDINEVPGIFYRIKVSVINGGFVFLTSRPFVNRSKKLNVDMVLTGSEDNFFRFRFAGWEDVGQRWNY